jgi:hypothetical protein
MDADLSKEKDLNRCARSIPPRTRNAVFVCHSTRLELQRVHDVNLQHEGYAGIAVAYKRGSPCPSGHNPRRDKAGLDATRSAAELL